MFGVLASLEFNNKVAEHSRHEDVTAPVADDYFDLYKIPAETGVTSNNDENALSSVTIYFTNN